MYLRSASIVCGLSLCFGCGVAEAGYGWGAQVGEKAPLFKSLDESMQPVDMAPMIKGKPLVVIVGSVS